jgi:hypothetical protein
MVRQDAASTNKAREIIVPVRHSYPSHLIRRRRREPLSADQHQRFIEEKNAQRLEVIEKFISEHLWYCGPESFGDVEYVACKAWDRLYGRQDESTTDTPTSATYAAE